MRPYTAYPSYQTGLEWTGGIPESWDIGRIKDYVELVNGYPFESSLFDKAGGIPLVRIRDVLRGSPETYYQGNPVHQAWIGDTDILIGMDGDYNICWWDDGPALLNQRVACLRAKEGLNQRFLYYLLPFPLKIINDLTYFTTVKHLSADEIRRIRFPLPTKKEQRNIARYLDYETARIDRLIEKQQQLIELLDEKRQAVISHAVTKGLNPDVPMKDSGVEWLGKVPADWNVAKIRWVAQLESGHTPSRNRPEYWEDCDIPWMTLSDIWQVRKEGRRYIVETAEKVSQLGLDNSSARLLPKGTVMLSRTASVGYPAIMGRDMATTQDFANWICGSKIKPEYLYFVLRAMSSEFDRLMRGSTHKTIYMPDIHELVTPVPSFSEQGEIVIHIERSLDGIGVLIEKAQQAVDLLRERRSALISGAVTGNIDVRDWKPPESANEAEEQDQELLEAAEERAGYG